MIQPKDLRMGDLVIVSETGCMIPKGVVCKVTAIDSESLLFQDRIGSVKLIPIDPKCKQITWSVWCKNIAPSPLTREILTLNGWSLVKRRIDEANFEWHVYSHEDNCVNIQYYPQSDSFSAFFIDNELCEIKYVHELQHILWVLKENADLKVPTIPSTPKL